MNHFNDQRGDDSSKDGKDDGYDTDHTSSYDSGDDVWYSHITMEILHGERTPHQPIELRGLHDHKNMWTPNRDLSVLPMLKVKDPKSCLASLKEPRPTGASSIWDLKQQEEAQRASASKV